MSKVIKVFIDTEFTDFKDCDLISLGMVTEDGKEFYAECTTYNKVWASDFVKAHVLPLCDFAKYGVPYAELSAKVWQWIDELDCDEVIIMIDYETDYTLLLNLLDEKHPKIRGSKNIFNHLYSEVFVRCTAMGGEWTPLVEKARKVFFEESLNHFFETKEIEHHALSDARANRRGYTAMMKSIGLDF